MVGLSDQAPVKVAACLVPRGDSLHVHFDEKQHLNKDRTSQTQELNSFELRWAPLTVDFLWAVDSFLHPCLGAAFHENMQNQVAYV